MAFLDLAMFDEIRAFLLILLEPTPGSISYSESTDKTGPSLSKPCPFRAFSWVLPRAQILQLRIKSLYTLPSHGLCTAREKPRTDVMSLLELAVGSLMASARFSNI